MHKKTWIIILILILAAGGYAAAMYVKRSPDSKPAAPAGQTGENKPEAATTPSPGTTQVTAVKSTALPAGMPSDLPFEKGAEILQNFEIKMASSTQATRVYVSKKTLEESLASYQKYLKDHGWTVTSSLIQPAIKNLGATKAEARLDITMATENGRNTVSVTYVK